MRESNPQLTITNGLLYHLTNPAPAQHSSSKHRIIGGFKTNHLIRRTSRHLIACSGKCLQQQGGVTTGKISPQNAYLITSILAYHAAPINQRISKNLRPCKTVNHQAMVSPFPVVAILTRQIDRMPGNGCANYRGGFYRSHIASQTPPC